MQYIKWKYNIGIFAFLLAFGCLPYIQLKISSLWFIQEISNILLKTYPF